MLDRALGIEPNDAGLKIARAEVECDWKANTRPVHQLIDEIRVKDPTAIQSVADSWLICALAERDPAAAANALAALGENGFGSATVRYSPRFGEGLIARMTKDDAKAHAAFTAAREDQEKLVRDRPDDVLAAEAVRFGERDRDGHRRRDRVRRRAPHRLEVEDVRRHRIHVRGLRHRNFANSFSTPAAFRAASAMAN